MSLFLVFQFLLGFSLGSCVWLVNVCVLGAVLLVKWLGLQVLLLSLNNIPQMTILFWWILDAFFMLQNLLDLLSFIILGC